MHNTALMITIKGLLVRSKDNVSQLSDKETGVAVEEHETQVYPDTLPELWVILNAYSLTDQKQK